MSAFIHWLIEMGQGISWPISVLTIKITAVLAIVWLLHFELRRANPRWRVLVWRLGTIGVLVLAALAACPPLIRLPMLPPANSRAVSPVAMMERPSEQRIPTATTPSESPAVNRKHTIAVDERETAAAPVGVTQSQPATVQTQPFPWLRFVVIIYWAGVVVGLARIALSLLRVRRVCAKATSAPDTVELEAAKIAAHLRLRPSFAMRQSMAVHSPCLVGVWLPTILLPMRQCCGEYGTELPSILAHELAHLRGRDLFWNNLLACLATLLWFHPLAWRMRLAHADACDEVSDAVAADYLGDGASYGRTLARLAVRTASPAAMAGLAMARPSGIRRRVELVQRHVFRYALPRRRTALVLASGAIACILLGGLALTRSAAEPQNNDTPAAVTPPTSNRLKIHVVVEKSDEPLADVQINYHGSVDGQRFAKKASTGAGGTAELELPAGKKIGDFWFTAKKATFVPMNYWWIDDRRDIELPPLVELRFQPGQTIGGVVQDEAGKPLADASIEITMPIDWPKLRAHVFTAAELKTDRRGRWQWDGAPVDLGKVSIAVGHLGYMKAWHQVDKSKNMVVVLKQGLQVSGSVVDHDLKPVAGASVALGLDRFGSDEPKVTTDREGRFLLKNCKSGRSLVTVMANGFSPQAKELTVGNDNKELLFVLEPGHTLRARVVDVEGKPVQGAFFAVDTWRGYRSLDFREDTPADGRIVWTSAPGDSVLCDIGKAGYMSSRQVAIKPDGDEQVITLYPVLEISGRVFDKRSGKPVPAFRVTHGYQFSGRSQTSWSDDPPIDCTDGKYTCKFDEPMKGYLLQVTARGYLAATSREIESSEGKVSVNFLLEPGDGPSGEVLLDGKPVEGAEVGLATREKRAFLDMGRFDRRQNHAEVVTTDSAGRFSFVPQTDEDFMLIVLHDGGFAQVTSSELKTSSKITLQPWGRIEGQSLVGQKPDVNREIDFQPKTGRPNDVWNYVFSFGYRTQTNNDGRFTLERVIPGPGSISRVVVTEFLKSSQHAPGWSQPVNVLSNETAKVNVGGSGRPVAGQLVLDRKSDVELDWTTNEPAEIDAWDVKRGTHAQPFRRYVGNIDQSGRFNIPDVPAGDYKLIVSVNNPPVPNACGAGEAIGRAEFTFTVPDMPDGRSDEPFDVGQITAKLFDTLDVGELAPDFVAESLDGGRVRLADLRGRLVLVDFWATWCGPCVAEMPNFKEIQQRFGDDKRFALLSVSCDADRAAAKKFVDESALNWQHVNVEGTSAQIPKNYTVRALPATFLIGPNGRVIAKNLRGAELIQAVNTAMGNDKLFQDTSASPPARFPLVRFATAGDPSGAIEPGSLVIADDTDENFEKDKSHADGIRMLSPSGEQLWADTDLNNCETVGGVHGVAVDRGRGRIYVRELVSNRIRAYSSSGQKLWQIENIPADTLTVDEKTGNLWSSGGSKLNDGETVVFDPQGNEVAAYPYRAIDMTYDPHDDAFWLAGYEILKLSRDGKVLFRKPVDGWCYASLSVNPTDGSVWLAERKHPDVQRSKNRLWLLASDGTSRLERDLGDDDIFVVACNPKNEEAWFSGYHQGLCRVTPSGKVSEALPIVASNIAFSPTTGDLWVSTEKEVLKLDRSGTVVKKSSHRSKSSEAWLAAF
jgi:beta-lactamase regulating signal transducer with metallopeptidase domain/thiol-disulfide isomerase/thioredoxin/uncharacterized GH25 family protein